MPRNIKTSLRLQWVLAAPASCLAKTPKKVEHLCREGAFSCYSCIPPPLPSVLEPGFQQYYTSSRPNGITGDFSSVEFNLQSTAKIEPQGVLLSLTNWIIPYQMVETGLNELYRLNTIKLPFMRNEVPEKSGIKRAGREVESGENSTRPASLDPPDPCSYTIGH